MAPNGPARQDYIAFTMLSVIFLASPSSIMVLSRVDYCLGYFVFGFLGGRVNSSYILLNIGTVGFQSPLIAAAPAAP